MRLKLLILACLVGFSMMATVSEAAEETVHQTHPVKAGTAVEIENINGDVTVSSWDKDYVDVVAVKRSNEGKEALDRVTIEAVNNGMLTIRTVYGKKEPESDFFITRLVQKITSGFPSGPNVSVNFTVSIPSNTELAGVRTQNGDISVANTNGDAQIRSTNGAVKVERFSGIITSETTNGDITVIESPGLVKARTVNGGIEVTFPGLIETDTDISTVNGSVSMNADPNMNAVIDFRTVNGRISAEGFSVMLNTVSPRQLVGSLGNGGRTIKVQTVNGSIRMNKK